MSGRHEYDERSTWRRSARTSRSWSGRSTGTRWCTSTARTPRRSPARCIDAMARALRAAQRQRGPLGAHARHRGDRRVRGCPGQGGRVHRRHVARTRWCSPRTPPRRSTWWRTRSASGCGPGDEIVISEMEHHSNIVPWQLLCRAYRRDAALVRPHRRGPARSVHTGRAGQRADQHRQRRPRLQHARHDQPDRADRRAGARGRRAGACSTARSRCRTCRSTWPRSASTSSPSPGTRCSARPGSACCGARVELLDDMPPFLGGGSMIETVTMAEDHVRGRRRPGSRPVPRRSPQAVGLGRGRGLPDRAGHAARSAARAGAHRVRAGRSVHGGRAADLRADGTGRPRRYHLLRRWTACTRTTWGRSSTRSASRCASGTTAPDRPASGSGYRR